MTGTRLASLLLLPALAALAQQAPYTQPFRSQIHFSPNQHWMNDPNGLVFFEGEYHLFFQYNPQGDTPGHIGWGHAVSTDLLHWHELPGAIPEQDGEAAFTGSTVVDEHNTSGLCQNAKPCLVAIYTGNRGDGPTQREYQNIASSQDRGRTWQRFQGNPVLDLQTREFRDPGVFWSAQAKAWIMAVSQPNEHQVVFYSSPNLKQWTEASRFGPAGLTTGQWECPDLVQIPSAQGPSLWALKVGLNPGSLQGGSGEQYFLGSFDGKSFTQSTLPGAHGWSDYGKDSYCAISYNHLRQGENPTLIGWMDNWQYADRLPTSPWRGQMTIPRRVTLRYGPFGLLLRQQPVVAPLRQGQGTVLTAHTTADPVTLGQTKTPAELTVTFQPADAQTIGLKLYSDPDHYTEISFDREKMTLAVDRTHANGPTPDNFPARTEAPLTRGLPLDLHFILDRNSLEVFAQTETIAMTNLIFPITPQTRIELVRTGGTQPIRATGHLWPLNSIWPTTKASK